LSGGRGSSYGCSGKELGGGKFSSFRKGGWGSSGRGEGINLETKALEAEQKDREGITVRGMAIRGTGERVMCSRLRGVRGKRTRDLLAIPLRV